MFFTYCTAFVFVNASVVRIFVFKTLIQTSSMGYNVSKHFIKKIDCSFLRKYFTKKPYDDCEVR